MRSLTLLAIPFLTACMTYEPRHYDYDVDLRNSTGRPVSVEFLRIKSSSVGKTRCDLADRGLYIDSFTTSNSAEYLEARVRYMDDPDASPR
jgi:hypothetical protein